MTNLYNGWTPQPKISPHKRIEHLARLCSGTQEQIKTNLRIRWYEQYPTLLLRDELYLAECRLELEAALHELDIV